MFGKRTGSEPVFRPTANAAGAAAQVQAKPAAPREVAEPAAAAPKPQGAPAPQTAPQVSKPVARAVPDSRSEDYYQIKSTIFNALIDTIDLAQLAQLDPDSAREEIRDIVNEIISIKAVDRKSVV